MRSPRQSRSLIGLNMTPLIDVVFQLLIFFVCTVEFQRQEEILATRLSAVSHAGVAAQPSPAELDFGRIDVELTSAAVSARFQGRSRTLPIEVGDAVLSDLQQQLRDWTRLERRIPVRIRCRPDVPTGMLLKVYDACAQLGLEDVAIVDEVRR